MKKLQLLAVFILGFFLLAFFIYLMLPAPSIPPLPHSEKSTEPGDTVQVPNVSGYFTDMDRGQVTKFYQKSFSKSSLFGLPLPTVRLNHPPEYARTVIRDQILSSYLEEYVHPLRDSLYVNGWEPDVYFKNNPGAAEQFKVTTGGKRYFSKVTIRTFPSSVILRVVIFVFGLILSFLFVLLFRRIIRSRWTIE